MAIGVAHLGIGQRHQVAQTIDGVGFDQNVLGFGAIAAGIHDDGATDRTRHAAIEFKPGNPGLGGRLGDLSVERGGTRVDPRLGARLDMGEGLAQTDDNAVDAAITDQQIRADADGQHRYFRIKRAQEGLKIGDVLGQENDLGRTADAKPGERRQGRAMHNAAAHRRQLGDPVAGAAHALALSASS